MFLSLADTNFSAVKKKLSHHHECFQCGSFLKSRAFVWRVVKDSHAVFHYLSHRSSLWYKMDMKSMKRLTNNEISLAHLCVVNINECVWELYQL